MALPPTLRYFIIIPAYGYLVLQTLVSSFLCGALILLLLLEGFDVSSITKHSPALSFLHFPLLVSSTWVIATLSQPFASMENPKRLILLACTLFNTACSFFPNLAIPLGMTWNAPEYAIYSAAITINVLTLVIAASSRVQRLILHNNEHFLESQRYS